MKKNIKLYFENGILFPLFRKNDKEAEFKSILKQYFLEYNKHLDSNYDIIELASDKVTITKKELLQVNSQWKSRKSPKKFRKLGWTYEIFIFLCCN